MNKIIVGIDPGVKTGLAIWKPATRNFLEIKTLTIVAALIAVEAYRSAGLIKEVWFEDARLRTWFGNADREKLQGAGSIKRDCAIWQEFCEYYKIPFRAIKPAPGQTKWSAEYFKKLSGWQGRTSQHARDAAALVIGAK